MKEPKNLARLHMGGVLLAAPAGEPWEMVSSSDESLASLLSDNPGARAELPPGEMDLLLDLQDFYRIGRFAFRTNEGEGKVSLYGGNAPHPPGSERWQALGAETAFGEGDRVKVEFPLTEIRFARMRFSSAGGVNVSPILLSGDQTLEEFSPRIPPVEEWPDEEETPDRIEFDFARLAAGGRITYVGSGNPGDAYMIGDDDPDIAYEFPGALGDAIFLVELSDAYSLSRASLLLEQTIASVEIRLFETLPTSFLFENDAGGEVGTLVIPPRFFEEDRPSMRVEIGEPESAVHLSLPATSARYILVRVFGLPPEEPLRLGQFSVIGEIPREYAHHHRGELLLQPITAEAPDFAAPAASFAPDPPRLPPASF